MDTMSKIKIAGYNGVYFFITIWSITCIWSIGYKLS